MAFLLFVVLLSAPFLSGWDETYSLGYAKELAFCVLSLILVCTALVRRREWPIRIYDVGALLLLAAIVSNPRFWDNGAYLSVAFVLIGWSATRLRWTRATLYAIVVAGTIHALMSLGRIVLLPPPPLKGVMGNSGVMGVDLALIVPVALGLAFVERRKWQKGVAGVVAVVMFVALALTRSRTALLACLGGMACLLWHYVPFRIFVQRCLDTRFRRFVAGAAIVTAVIVGSVVLLSYRTGSVNGRMLIYRVTVEMIMDKPLLGHGYDTFAARYPDYQAAFFVRHPNSPLAIYADNTKVGFNEYLHIAAESGLVGLAVVIGLIIALFRIPGTGKPIAVLCRGSLVALLIAACFSYPLRRYETLLVVTLLVGMLAAQDDRAICVLPRWVGWGFVPLLFWFYVDFSTLIYKQAEGYSLWQQARSGERSVDERWLIYEKASARLAHHLPFLCNYAVVLSASGEVERGNVLFSRAFLYMNTSELQVMVGANDERAGRPNDAEIRYLRAWNMVPNRFYPLYRLMMLYQKQKDTARMRRTACAILAKKVKIPSYTVRRIREEAARLLE
ncbi:O-antigen ligase family protein [Millionella massiliensis]|uniref:O-antigen ligase family protein n=1 Tax=Millionella massiliensis TaxID=1871023 RepID=UPI0008DA9DF1|nr:O-antigen ligase family protein [Millionella massiliensis]